MANKTTSKGAGTSVLIEWNEETQSLHLNEVVGKASKHKSSSPEYVSILACKSMRQAMLITDFLESVVVGRLKKGEHVSRLAMKFAAKNLAEFSKQMAKSLVKEWSL